MTRFLCTLFAVLITAFVASAQHSETRSLSSFDAIDLDGHARIYLEEGDSPSVRISVKKEHLLDEYRSEVRNGTLYLNFRREKDNDNRVKLYITHTGLEKMDVDGLVRVYTDNPIVGTSFDFKGDGFIKGDIEVDVDDLRVDTDGFIGLDVRGRAYTADLQIDGFGSIGAHDLEVDRPRKSADGFARVSY